MKKDKDQPITSVEPLVDGQDAERLESFSAEPFRSPEEMKRLIQQLRVRVAALEKENGHPNRTFTEGDWLNAPLFRYTTDSIFSVDSQYRLQTFNERFSQRILQLVGTTPTLGDSIFGYVLPEQRDYFRQLYQRVLAGERIQEVVEYKMANGESCIYDKVFNPVWNTSQKVTGCIVISRDITENKHVEESLRESEQRFRELFACNPHPMWIYENKTGAFLEVNEAAVVHYGYTREEFLSMTIYDIRPPEEARRLKEFRKIPKNDFETFGEWTHRKKDGSLIVVEVSGHMLPMKHGQSTRFVLAHDITERKRAEEGLRLREAQFSSLIDNTTDVIFSFDQYYRLTVVNEMLRKEVKRHWNKDIRVGMHLADTLSPQQTDYFQPLFERALRGERFIQVIEIPIQHDVYYYESSFNPIRNGRKEVIGCSVISRNVTNRQRREANLMYRENILNSIFHESPDAILLLQTQGMIVDCNRRAVEMFEAEARKALIGMYGVNLRKQVPGQQELDRIVTGLTTEGSWNAEVEYVTFRGRIFWGSVSNKKIDIASDGYYLVRISDITQRKQAKATSDLYSSYLYGIIESTSDVIFSLDTQLRYTSFNTNHREMMSRLYGVDIEIGKKFTTTLPHLASEQEQMRSDVLRALRGEQFTVERMFGGATGTYFEIRLNPIRNGKTEVIGVAIFAKDITEGKQAQEKMRTSLREKEVLLSEVYHRVKNNLNVVISLLNLQASRSNDPRLVEALTDSRNRLYAMALVHEQLYRTSDFSRINTAEYIRNLARNVREAYLVSRFTVKLQIAVDERVFLPLDVSIPLGLILNELLTNCFKHAFPSGHDGFIGIELTELEGNLLCLAVWDNGVGFIPSSYASGRVNSLGLRLVEMLVDQLKGNFRYLPVTGQLVGNSEEDTLKKHKIEIIFKHP